MSTEHSEKHCPRCGITKARSAFSSQPKRPGGISSWCLACCRAATAERRAASPGRDKAYADANRDVLRARWKRYYEANRKRLADAKASYKKTPRGAEVARNARWRDRARSVGAAGEFSWDEILRAQGGRCLFCGSSQRLTVDHIVPLSRGGSNGQENVRVLCKTCNSRKGTKLDSELPTSMQLAIGQRAQAAQMEMGSV